VRFAVAVLTSLVLVAQSQGAVALDQQRVFRGALLLEGQIVPGDFEKLLHALRDKNLFQKIKEGVFLASPGGDVLEAMRMGLLLRSLQLKTLAPVGPSQFAPALVQARDLKNPNNYVCSSACIFLYIAGADRTPASVGRLGVHQPSAKPKNSEAATQELVHAAEAKANTAIAVYLRAMGITDELRQIMISTPADQIHWITADEFAKYIYGRSPELAKAVEAACGAAIQEKNANFARCAKNVQTAASEEAWAKQFGSR
jgi:hypothetical protein